MKILNSKEEKQEINFFNECIKEAEKSGCSDAKCGSIIVKDNLIIGKGFNSPPGNLETQRRCKNFKDSYHKRVTDKTCCVHAEQRAIFNALKNHQKEIQGSRLYFIRIDKKGNKIYAGNPFCTICSKMALDAGIKEFVLWHEKGICVYDTQEYNNLSFTYSGD
ncbi:MAG: hypothetical protein ACOYT4_02900 [Nanoarchaeota archaeon]